MINNEFFELIDSSTGTLLLEPVVQVSKMPLSFLTSDICTIQNEFILTECTPGYTGPECAYSCIYPYYGEDCFKECDCQINLCDHQLGCNTSFTDSTSKHLKHYLIKS